MNNTIYFDELDEDVRALAFDYMERHDCTLEEAVNALARAGAPTETLQTPSENIAP